MVCFHERELCGFVHGDDFIITGDSVQLMWMESRLKAGLNFERCADLGVDDGVDKTVTILSQLATWSNQTGILLARMSMDGFDICVVLCCGCEVRTGTSRNSIARTNQEFVRYANVGILEFIHVYFTNCQTEKGPMRIMTAHRLTIFQGVKIEVAVFMIGPNKESRRWLSRMRAWKEEYDVCSSLPQSLSVAESEFVEFARSGQHDDQFGEGVAQCARGANNSSDGGCHKAMWSGTSSIFAVRGALVTRTCEFSCDMIENVQESSERSKNNKYYGTSRNVEDGMWRWTYSTDVVCSALSCNGFSRMSCLQWGDLEMSCNETKDAK